MHRGRRADMGAEPGLHRCGAAHRAACETAGHLSADCLLRTVTYVGLQQLSVPRARWRDNLIAWAGRPQPTRCAVGRCWNGCAWPGFLRGPSEGWTPHCWTLRASNLSGGQRQRLALARALLHDSPVYVFDEATSNIDVESENDIMAEIRALARRRTVLRHFTHRLANVIRARTASMCWRPARVAGQRQPHAALLAQGRACTERLWDMHSRIAGTLWVRGR